MKKLIYLLLVITLLDSCKKDGSQDENSSTSLGGETNIEINQVGNIFSPAAISIGGNYITAESSIETIKTENGVNTIKMIIDMTKTPELATFNNMIPAQYKDGQGRLNAEVKVKMTSEGILDYTNKDGAPFVAVKYGCNVGDQYQLTKSDGKTITRKVVQKSTTDDFSWGFYMIKTITVEQDSRLPGIKKIVYRFNHKFGLVAFELHGDDRSVLSGLVYPKYP
jgi:hypothetical protein